MVIQGMAVTLLMVMVATQGMVDILPTVIMVIQAMAIIQLITMVATLATEIMLTLVNGMVLVMDGNSASN